MENQIKISIIMPNFNGAKTIEESINSFINNKYKNKELIIVDGKSSDGSFEIIEKYNDNFDCIKWIKNPDNGISDAINKGLEYATGQIIGYLGNDDLLNKDTLLKVNENKNLVDFDAIYFDSYTYYLDKNIIQLRKCPNVIFNRANLIKFGTIVGLQNIFFDKKVFKNIKYDVNNKYSMDYEIYFRIIESFSNFMYVEYPATINKFDNNISYRLSKVQTKEALDLVYKYMKISDYKYLPYKRILVNFLQRMIIW